MLGINSMNVSVMENSMAKVHFALRIKQYTFTPSVVAFLVGSLFIRPAAATYTVIDDDLLPSAIIEARDGVAGQSSNPHPVPFARKSVVLGPLGRKAVEQILAQAPPSATFKIIGRSDAQPSNVFGNDGGAILPVATARGNALSQYLIRLGVSPGNIILAPDNSPNPQQNGSNYLSHIVLVNNASPALTTNPGQRPALTPSLTPVSVTNTPLTPKPPPAATEAPAVMPPPANPIATTEIQRKPAAAIATRERMVAFINTSVQNGTMDAAVALSLISGLLTHEPDSSRMPTASVPAPATNPVTPAAPVRTSAPVAEAPSPATPAPLPSNLFSAPSALARKPSWLLDKTMTLRDNLDAWSKKAGWQATQWDASNYYEVTHNVPMEGEFPDVLRQIADGTSLNICPNKRLKFVRVTDPTVRCDK